MNKYDIRDQYELHNLLRKIVQKEAVPTLVFGKMPMLTFGQANRAMAMLELIIEHSPLSLDDLQAYAREAYGFEPGALVWKDIVDYYHDGMFVAEQKAMTSAQKNELLAHLTDDFYFISEIRQIWMQFLPDADIEDINSYNLRQMGFQIRSNYVFRNHSSTESYFTQLLTANDVFDVRPFSRRFEGIQSYHIALSALRKNLDIIEFKPRQYIHIRKLEQAGIIKQDLMDFCESIWQFVPENTYFSYASLKQQGFCSELEDFGFSDRFYASILNSDTRFSFGTVFGVGIFIKGTTDITIKSFEVSLVQQAGSIDVYDLQSLMTQRYGCIIGDTRDIVYKLQGTEVYYDPILDRLYASEMEYERDIAYNAEKDNQLFR